MSYLDFFLLFSFQLLAQNKKYESILLSYCLPPFLLRPLSQTNIPEGENGVVYFNPEYGDRLGVEAELEITYKRLGDFLKKKCKGYFGYIFTGNLELGKKIGLKPSRRIEFYTSKIDCRLFEYELYSGTKRVDK